MGCKIINVNNNFFSSNYIGLSLRLQHNIHSVYLAGNSINGIGIRYNILIIKTAILLYGYILKKNNNKNIHISSNTLTYLISITLLGAIAIYLFFIYKPRYKKTEYNHEEAKSTDSSLIDRISSGEFTSGRDSDNIDFEQFTPLFIVMAGYENALNSLYNGFNKDLKEKGAAGLIELILDHPDSIASTGDIINKVSYLTGIYSDSIIFYGHKTAVRIDSLVKAGFPDAGEIGKIKNMISGGNHTLNEYLDIQRNILALIKKIKKFIKSKNGRYKIEGKEIIFDNEKDSEAFRSFGIKLLEYKQQEMEWEQMIERQGGFTDDKVINEIEDLISAEMYDK